MRGRGKVKKRERERERLAEEEGAKERGREDFRLQGIFTTLCLPLDNGLPN